MCDIKVSVVVVDCGDNYFLEQCLCSVHAALSGMDSEVFVVDSASADDSAVCETYLQCKGEYVLLLSSATVIGEENVRSICYFMDEHTDAGVARVRLLDGHGACLKERKRSSFVSLWVSFCHRFGLSKLLPQPESILTEAYMLLRRESLLVSGEPGGLRYEGLKKYDVPERVLCCLGESTKKVKRRRLLAICHEDSFEEVKAASVSQMPELEFVNLWDLDEERVMDAICRRNLMKGFTDIAFCYPEVRFEQMLLLMDTMANKKTTYHIYNKKSSRLVSPGK